jgi:hypothetical protein
MPVFVVLIVAIPFVFAGWLLHRILDHRIQVKRIQAGAQPPPALPPAPPEVERRLANLEAIVSSLDYDFAARITARDDSHAA